MHGLPTITSKNTYSERFFFKQESGYQKNVKNGANLFLFKSLQIYEVKKKVFKNFLLCLTTNI